MLSGDMLTVKVQFVNDTDPFSSSISYLEPPRGPTYSFNVNIPIGEQIPAIHRLLRAPQKVLFANLHNFQAHTTVDLT